MKKKILVTGAGGYIGRHIVNELLNKGCDVLASDFKFENIDKRAKYISYPIFSNDDDIYDKLEKPDVCIHLAWRNGFIHNADSHMEDLSDHYMFLKKMIDGGLKHITVMGSMHEIGYWEGPIDEDTPTNPLSLYGIAKNSLRQAISSIVKDKDIVFQWIRAYYIMGDDLHNNSIFSKIMKMEQDDQEIFPLNSGKNKYDFIEVNELAKQISAVATQNKINGIINCCSGVPISLGEKVEQFIKINGLKIKPKYGVFPDRPYDSPAVWGDNSKIKKIIR